jgi:GNAT superfamily N-acetyltransferase
MAIDPMVQEAVAPYAIDPTAETDEAGFSPEDVKRRIDVSVATSDDAETLSWLVQELLAFYGMPSKHPRSYLAHLISTRAFTETAKLEILIARDRQSPTGFLAFSETFALANCQQSLFIQDLFVTRRARGRAVGYHLMKRLAEIAVERGVEQVDWTADAWNDRAAKFYERLSPHLKSDKVFYRLLGPNLRSFLNSKS